jgi:hypothetical protein
VGGDLSHNIESAERHDVARAAAIALLCLVVGVGLLFYFGDRARGMDVVSAAQAEKAYFDDVGAEGQPVLYLLMRELEHEDSEWARTNEDRGLMSSLISAAVGLCAVATLVELVLLYNAVS